MAKKETPWVKWSPEKFLNGISDLETANEILVYVIVLNLIYDKQGPWPYSAKKLAARCKLRQPAVEKAVNDLIGEGKLQMIDGCLTNEKAQEVIGQRQGVSEKAQAAANARWQEETGKGNDNKGAEDASASGSHQKSDAIKEEEGRREKKKKASPPLPKVLDLDGGPDVSPARQAFDLYNQVAARVGGTVHSDMTEGWRNKLNARMNGRGFPVWQEAMEMVERSLFLCGEAPVKRGERPFKLHLEMLLRPDNFQKLMDGFYGTDREPRAADEPLDANGWSKTRWSRVMEIWDKTGSWPDDAGPEPGQPGCRAPNGDSYVHQ